VNRLYDWAPYMSEDMKWFIWGLYALVRDVLSPLQSEGDTAANIMERYGTNFLLLSLSMSAVEGRVILCVCLCVCVCICSVL